MLRTVCYPCTRWTYKVYHRLENVNVYSRGVKCSAENIDYTLESLRPEVVIIDYRDLDLNFG